MSKYIGFKMEPGQQIPKWYFSKERPEDPYIFIEIKALWNTISHEEEDYIQLSVKEGIIDKVLLVKSNHDFDDNYMYLRLYDLIVDKIGDLPTQPLDDE